LGNGGDSKSEKEENLNLLPLPKEEKIKIDRRKSFMKKKFSYGD